MSTYEAGSALRKAGVVSERDMTSEAAIAKLYYLFNVCDDADTIKQRMEEDIRGELTPEENE